MFDLGQKDDLGKKYCSIKVRMDEYIRQGLVSESIRDGNATFNFKISVVAQLGQTLAGHAMANIKPNTKEISGDQLMEIFKHSAQTVSLNQIKNRTSIDL